MANAMKTARCGPARRCKRVDVTPERPHGPRLPPRAMAMQYDAPHLRQQSPPPSGQRRPLAIRSSRSPEPTPHPQYCRNNRAAGGPQAPFGAQAATQAKGPICTQRTPASFVLSPAFLRRYPVCTRVAWESLSARRPHLSVRRYVIYCIGGGYFDELSSLPYSHQGSSSYGLDQTTALRQPTRFPP